MFRSYTREADPYAANRERLAYGRSYTDPLAPPTSASSRILDPYETARRIVSTYDSVSKAADPYYSDPRRADPYSTAARDTAGYSAYETSAASAAGRTGDSVRPVDPYDLKTSQDRYATVDTAAKR